MSNLCIRCNKVFKGDGFKNHCARNCFIKSKYEDMIGFKISSKKNVYELICSTCHVGFVSNSKNIKYCSHGCCVNSYKMSPEDKIRIANEKWLNGENKVIKKKKSLSQLNKEAEWKRVFDDESWTNRFNTSRG